MHKHSDTLLSRDNPRLHELKAQYSAFMPPELGASQWTEQYLFAEIPFAAFRGECAYVWQTRDLNAPVNLLLTAFYFLSEGGMRADLLRKLDEDGAYGAYTLRLDGSMYVSRDLLDSVNEIDFLVRHRVLSTEIPGTVLDIGSGYGRFAHRLDEAFDGLHRVLCTDAIAESSFLCEYYLAVRCARSAGIVPLPALSAELLPLNVDVAVNMHSFSECTLAAVNWWLSLLRLNQIRYLMIVPNAGQHGGREMLTRERSGSRLSMMPLILQHGYRLKAAEPKYANAQVQALGVTPTWYYLFELNS